MKADQKTASGGLRSTPIIGGISQKRRSLGRGGDPPLNKNLGREYRPIFAPHPKLDKRHQNSTKSYTFACKIRMPPQTPSALRLRTKKINLDSLNIAAEGDVCGSVGLG